MSRINFKELADRINSISNGEVDLQPYNDYYILYLKGADRKIIRKLSSGSLREMSEFWSGYVIKYRMAYRMKDKCRLQDNEREFINGLNTAGESIQYKKFTAGEKTIINGLYYKYIEEAKLCNEVLYKIEMKEPFNKKYGEYQAKLIVLIWLNHLKTELTTEQAADLFLMELESRTANQLLVANVYERNSYVY